MKSWRIIVPVCFLSDLEISFQETDDNSVERSARVQPGHHPQ